MGTGIRYASGGAAVPTQLPSVIAFGMDVGFVAGVPSGGWQRNESFWPRKHGKKKLLFKSQERIARRSMWRHSRWQDRAERFDCKWKFWKSAMSRRFTWRTAS